MQYGSHPYEIGSTTAYGVTPLDIAHSLARINRFTGHTKGVLSVARHSVYVSELLNEDNLVSMYGLLHELGETVINDISQPVKAALGEDGMRRLKEIESAAEVAFFEVMGVPHPMPPDIKKLVKDADNAAVLAEKRDLMRPCARPWTMVPGEPAERKATATTSAIIDTVLFTARYQMLAQHLNIMPKQWARSATS